MCRSHKHHHTIKALARERGQIEAKLKICAQFKIKWCSKKLQERCLIEEINNSTPGTLLIIDYLQSIKSYGGAEPYLDLLQKIKLITQQNKSRIFILSQVNEESSDDPLDYIAGGRSIGRHFTHVIHLEQQQIEKRGASGYSVGKIYTLPKQKSLLQLIKKIIVLFN